MTRRSPLRLVALVALAALALQLTFAVRIALMRVVDPASTSFERSEIWRLARERSALDWRQRWTPYTGIATNLKRAVIASEDAGFVDHLGIDWEALRKAWERNRRSAARLEHPAPRPAADAPAATPSPAPGSAKASAATKLVGGSTITQQLAKNLLLTGERSLVRKGQEFVLTLLLEACLDKRRILEIYLNHVEWGEGVFGADAAARRYFGVGADALSVPQAARLAVLLPAPKRFERRTTSAYVAARSGVVAARMGTVTLPAAPAGAPVASKIQQ